MYQQNVLETDGQVRNLNLRMLCVVLHQEMHQDDHNIVFLFSSYSEGATCIWLPKLHLRIYDFLAERFLSLSLISAACEEKVVI